MAVLVSPALVAVGSVAAELEVFVVEEAAAAFVVAVVEDGSN